MSSKADRRRRRRVGAPPDPVDVDRGGDTLVDEVGAVVEVLDAEAGDRRRGRRPRERAAGVAF